MLHTTPEPDPYLSSLTEENLLDMSKHVSMMTNNAFANEWYRRYGINFPYRLTKWGEVLNCITLQVMKDEDLDKFIKGQADFVKSFNKVRWD